MLLAVKYGEVNRVSDEAPNLHRAPQSLSLAPIPIAIGTPLSLNLTNNLSWPMTIEQQFIFLFSALGALNGFALSAWFLLKRGEKRRSDYFLGGLLLMLSIRIIKSVFLYFNGGLFSLFITTGLIACCLIGPFLYLYVRSMTTASGEVANRRWYLHVAPWAVALAVLGFAYPYGGPNLNWGWIVEAIYKVWLGYILLSLWRLRPVLKAAWEEHGKLTGDQVWLLNIVGGTLVVYVAYETASYTSYITGALSFTFLLYVSVLHWFFRRNNRPIATDEPIKPVGVQLGAAELAAGMAKLTDYMTTARPHLEPDLTLAKLGGRLGTPGKDLSRLINQATGENYSRYIARARVAEAQKLLLDPNRADHKISAIAYDSGFNSLSSFNSYFREFTGQTAKSYQKAADIAI